MRFADLHFGLYTICAPTVAAALIGTNSISNPPKANKSQNPLPDHSCTRLKQAKLYVLFHRIAQLSNPESVLR